MKRVDGGHGNAMTAAVLIIVAGLAGWAIIALTIWDLFWRG